MKWIDWLKHAFEYLGGERDEPPVGLPLSVLAALGVVVGIFAMRRFRVQWAIVEVYLHRFLRREPRR